MPIILRNVLGYLALRNLAYEIKPVGSMEAFEQILIIHNCARREQIPPLKIKEIEEAVGFELPDDYKTYLQNFQPFADFIGKEYVVLDGAEEIVGINKVTLIFDTLPNTLRIGDNGAGEIIALERLESGYFRIVLTPYILDKQDHIEIGNSFTDFLIRLESGRKWFDK